MKTLIVEKTIVRGGCPACGIDLCAVATSEPIPQTMVYSLTFEAYLTPWTSRADAENLRAKLAATENKKL
jgi:hypothetical protein